jgi:glycosyl transferase family 25
MRAVVINIASATGRMRFMAAQLDALGLAWERIEAVTPDTLEPGPEAAVWQRWQRPLRVTEMALCASHMAAWRRIRDLDAPCLVLEDDAVLAAGLPDFLARVAGLSGIEHISLETRGRRKLVARRPHPEAPMRRLYLDRTGSAAMVIWPAGAARLLAQAARAGAPSDALISGTPGLISYQADPALAVQADICAAYGLPQTLATASSIDAAPKPPPADLPGRLRRAYRRRRIAAQIGMGWRLLRLAPVARRVHIRPAAAWSAVGHGAGGAAGGGDGALAPDPDAG